MERVLDAVALALLFVAAALSGCASGSEGDGVFVPAMHQGDRWVSETLTKILPAQGEGPEWVASFPPIRVREDHVVLEGTQSVLDRYGRPVPAIVIENVREYLDHPNPAFLEAFPDPIQSFQAIEATGGHWLVLGSFSYRFEAHTGADLGLLQGECDLDTGEAGLPVYAQEPVRYDFAALNGKTMRPGDSYVHERLAASELGPVAIRVEDHVSTGTTYPLAWIAGAPERDAVVVLRNTTLTYLDPPIEDMSRSYGHETRLTFADGVPVPVAWETLPRTGDAAKTTSHLFLYEDGGADLGVGDRAPLAAFGGPHPEGRFAAIARAPAMQGLRLTFGLEEAVDAMSADPRALEGAAWLDAHPDAYVAEALYTRDPANRTYAWELLFADSASYLRVAAQRHVTRAGVPIEEAEAWPVEWRGDAPPPDPERVRGVTAVDLRTAVHVASQFHPRGDDWGALFWVIGEGGFGLDAGRVGVYAGVFDPHRLRDPPELPVFIREMSWADTWRVVDARDGALAAAGGIGFACRVGVHVDPYVLL